MGADEGVTRRSVIHLTGAALAFPAAQFQSSNLENRRMSFTPTFVDLVRNYTTTAGTGAFVLGPAVNGFTDFAAALQAGESFYYSAIGVDKPAESEVGRGTLLANGTISRQAVNGALTNFTSGTKSIALIAAAEWFEKIEAGGSAAASSRAALAASPDSPGVALLTETGAEGLFVFDRSNLSALVAADPARAIHVPPAGDATGASGAWVRKYSGALDARWFGLRAGGDGAANRVALQCAIDFLIETGVSGYGYTYGAGRLHIQRAPAPYDIGGSIDVTGQVIVEGDGADSAGATVLKWPAGTTGFRVQGPHTSGEATYDATAHSAGHLVLRDIMLSGGYAGSEGEFHGILAHSGIDLANVYITQFQGDGICVKATAGAGTGDIDGNSNLWSIQNCRVEQCRNGFFCNGADVNAGQATRLDCSSNRQWGIWDSSFLGNTYTACHAATNGIVVGSTSMCSYAGQRYTVIPGQEAWCSANAPTGTAAGNQGWRYFGPGGPTIGATAWASGLSWRAGGPYYTDSVNGSSVIVGCYSEQGQPPSVFTAPTMVVGGLHGAGYVGSGLTALGTGAQTNLGIGAGDPQDAQVNISNTNTYSILSFKSSGQADLEMASAHGVRSYILATPKLQIYVGAAYATAAVIAEWTGSGLDLQAGKVLSVGGTQVIGARKPGWTAATGTASRSGFSTSTATTTQLAQTLKALIDDLIGHGLIGA